jgi:WD40-like Beta Propeller Repeat
MDRPIGDEQIHQQLELILASEGFAGAPKLQRFLRFIVEQALQGNEDQIKESVIGHEVYQKSSGYDPRLDATVRVEALKIRQRLDLFYDAAGADAAIRISIPKGSYVPRFELRSPPSLEGVNPPQEERVIKERPGSTGSRWWLALAGAASLTVGFAWLRWWPSPRSPGPAKPASRITQLTGLDSFSVEPALSADGSFVVYPSDQGSPGVLNLWRYNIEDGSATQITRIEMSARTPTISSDGVRVVFRLEDRTGVLAVVPSRGGTPPQPINTSKRGRNPRFSPVDQRFVFWVPQDEQTLDRGSVYLVNLADLRADPARLFAEFAHASYPVWSSTGSHIIALGTWQSNVADKEYDAWTLEVAGNQSQGQVRRSGLFPLLEARGLYRSIAERTKVQIGDWRDGWLYFSAPSGDGANLYRIRLSENETVSGEPEIVTTGAGLNTGVRTGANGMVFSSALVSYSLYSAPLRPGPEAPPQIRRLTRHLGMNMRASVDRSGRRAGWERRQNNRSGTMLWFEDLASGSGRELCAGTSNSRAFVLVSPDGDRAACQVLDGTKQAIYLEEFSGNGPPRRICEDCGAPSDWNETGSHLLYITGGRPAGVGLLEVATGRYRDLLNHPSYALYGARYKVDEAGNGWMALYADTGPRTRQVFQAPVRNLHPAAYREWIPVTDGAHWDLSPAWAPDGRSIYFVSERDGQRCIWNQRLDPATHRPVGAPEPIYHFHTPERTLMRSVSYRGAEAIWGAVGSLFFSLDQTASTLWLMQ